MRSSALGVIQVAVVLLIWQAAGKSAADAADRRGSLGLQASAAARHRLLARARHREARAAQDPYATTGPPTLGLANVTVPTPLPMAPGVDPWKDAQPIDTAIGAFLAAGLSERPTVTPPPTQDSLDIIRAGCPLLTTWPQELEVVTIDPCDHMHEGSWRDPVTAEPLVLFRLSCSPTTSGLSPRISYSTAGPHAELLAASQMMTTLVGSKIALMDCAGNVRYVIEEKVYKQKGSVDVERCEKFGSCDGTVWLQYFLKSADGALLAHTPYLQLFESTFDVVHPGTGALIARATRVGDWVPNSRECLGQRRWRLTYASPPPPGPFANPTEQWPIAALLTVASMRDASRKPSGLLAPTWCEISKTALSVVVAIVCAAACLTVGLVFLRDGVPLFRASLIAFESRVCPKRMRVPSKYSGA